MYKAIVLLSVLVAKVLCDANYSNINLPEEHMPFYFHNFPKEAERCLKDKNCPYRKAATMTGKCWGYEYSCKWDNIYSIPHCPGDHKGWVSTKDAQKMTFYTQADFGYVKQQIREMKVMCEPLFKEDSLLECSEHLRFCRGRNIMMNFTSLANREEPIRYKMDVLGEGDIGGYCELHKDRLQAEADHISPLQSWGPEIRYFTRLNRRPIIEGDCDVVIEKPTFILKIDASMYIYFIYIVFYCLHPILSSCHCHNKTVILTNVIKF